MNTKELYIIAVIGVIGIVVLVGVLCTKLGKWPGVLGIDGNVLKQRETAENEKEKMPSQIPSNTNTNQVNVTEPNNLQLGCATDILEFVQITSKQLDGDERTFEKFRILRNGIVEWARLNESGHLLDYAEPRNMDRELFNKIITTQSFLSPPHEGTIWEGWEEGHRYPLEIVAMVNSDYKQISLNSIPIDISILIDDLRRNIKAKPTQPGWYMMSLVLVPKPYDSEIGLGFGDVNIIDLTKSECDSGIAKDISEAIKAGRFISRIDDGSIQPFIFNKSTSKPFIAKFTGGSLVFLSIRQ